MKVFTLISKAGLTLQLRESGYNPFYPRGCKLAACAKKIALFGHHSIFQNQLPIFENGTFHILEKICRFS